MTEQRPILSEADFQSGLIYITEQSLALERKVSGRDLSVDTICFFTQSNEEYDFITGAVRTYGPVSSLSHGSTTYVETDLEISGQHIALLGVRQPDDSRSSQRGYGDYPVADYANLLTEMRDCPYAREIISGRGQPLIELRHLDFDVLGFIVGQEENKNGKN